MTASAKTVRRGLFGMFAGGLFVFGSAAIIAPVANAQPVPAPPFDCSASSVAGTVSTAAASEGAYLLANPQTNEALSTISAQPQSESQAAYDTFFAQNPQVKDQLTAIHAPVSALRNDCNVQVSPTPISQAVWSTGTMAEVPQVVPSPTDATVQDPMDPASQPAPGPVSVPMTPDAPMA